MKKENYFNTEKISNQRLENIKKYGTKENDEISFQFSIGKREGIGFCLGNLNKYLKRYISTSEKAENKEDIIKMHDYINRCEEEVTETANFDPIRGAINNKLYLVALDFSNELQRYLSEFYK